MKIIECRCCSANIRVSDYNFARFSKGEFILCEDCTRDLENNVNKTSKSVS